MPDASPTKWHLAHTTWFFETFILGAFPGHKPFDPAFGYLFNSYYEALGPRQPRPRRGMITRPSLAEVLAYRSAVDAAVERRLEAGELPAELSELFELGLHHEQQHQELILTDILHLLSQNPLEPAYADAPQAPAASEEETRGGWIERDGGLVEVGALPGEAFTFDNERPRHQRLLRPHRLAERLVTNGEYLEFILDGGYRRSEHWLSDGWAFVQENGLTAPLYWDDRDGVWSRFSLYGRRPLERNAPAVCLSYYEADAYARWRGARLPLEEEWEAAAADLPVEGNFLEAQALDPRPAMGRGLEQMFGDCWEWTSSAYSPYPGFEAASGAVGEYNGKFMINQMVLRGGSFATSRDHVRATYRNFFHPHHRWQFSGVRLAADAPRERHAPLVDATFRREVLEGLSRRPKRLPSKYFYDRRGSELFEEICGLEEYYPTRTEVALLEKIAPALADHIPAGAALIEFGSGASVKTRSILDAAPALAAYAPIDISGAALRPAAAAIAAGYPALEVVPIVADFTQRLRLPRAVEARPKVGFFPGSTIGNFDPDAAEEFLRRCRSALGADGLFIIGVDMVKDPEILVAAYDDRLGVTAAFNKNMLVRINRELGADFDLCAFRHEALWNAEASRMEMHLRALRSQTVHVAGRAVPFAEGETMHTENSYKYRPEAFEALCARAGWSVRSMWVSPDPQFAVFLLGPQNA